MTFDEARRFLQDHEDDYMAEDKSLVKGLLLLEKYDPIESTAAEHDIFYVAEHNESMTEEDILQLYKYGFHLDGDNGGWAYFT